MAVCVCLFMGTMNVYESVCVSRSHDGVRVCGCLGRMVCVQESGYDFACLSG